MREIWRYGIGQDSHRFVDDAERVLLLAGVEFPGERPLSGNSDADVVLHSLCNAISSVTGVNILGKTADRLAAQGLTDSAIYVQEALRTLDPAHNPIGRRYELVHVAVSIEAKRPHLAEHIPAMRAQLAALTGLHVADIGITATSGEGLTDFGRGEGIACFVTVSVRELRDY